MSILRLQNTSRFEKHVERYSNGDFIFKIEPPQRTDQHPGFDRHIKANGWKPDSEKATTIFSMGVCRGVSMTKIESILVDYIEENIDELLHTWTPYQDYESAPCVTPDVWEAVREGDAKAIRKVNQINPGVIFQYDVILRSIYRNTLIASLSPDRGQAFKALDWLTVALIPTSLNSTRDGAITTPRSKLGIPHLRVFWELYHAIVLVRAVDKATSARDKSGGRLLKFFPELKTFAGKTAGMTAANVGRSSWGVCIAGRPISELIPDVVNTSSSNRKTAKEDNRWNIVDPRRAALQILGDMTGFGYRSIYTRMLELNGGGLEKNLVAIRAEALKQANALMQAPSQKR